jgi:hypothetical protein
MSRTVVSKTLILALVAGTLGYTPAAVTTTSAQSQRPNTTASMRLPDLLSTPRISRCAVNDPPGAEQLVIDEAASKAKDSNGMVTIPVYWHIITTASGGGNVAPLVPAQMQVLNDTYTSSGFTFSLQNVQVVANDAWFFAEQGSAEEAAMKAALRTGGPDALNIYTTNGDVYLGWATLPFFYKFFPSYDGVVLWWAAMPGTGLSGPAPEEPDGVLTYDQGDTGTHEVGHWLGLNHTFAGGCTHPGDSIKDTPTEAEPQFFCVARDSCVGPPFRGTDPITNFMDYVDDVCMDNFTSEQTKRMRKHWHAFRDKKAR